MIFSGAVRQGPNCASFSATRTAFAPAASTFQRPSTSRPAITSSMVAGAFPRSALAVRATSRIPSPVFTPRPEPRSVQYVSARRLVAGGAAADVSARRVLPASAAAPAVLRNALRVLMGPPELQRRDSKIVEISVVRPAGESEAVVPRSRERRGVDHLQGGLPVDPPAQG